MGLTIALGREDEGVSAKAHAVSCVGLSQDDIDEARDDEDKPGGAAEVGMVVTANGPQF